jgi:hypothetical protein
MRKKEKVYAIPGYMPSEGTKKVGDVVTIRRAIPVSVYRCSQCSYLELHEERT